MIRAEWCDLSAAGKGGRSDCPDYAEPVAPWNVDFGGLWETLRHPGLSWVGDPAPLLAAAFWTCAALLVVALILRIRSRPAPAQEPTCEEG